MLLQIVFSFPRIYLDEIKVKLEVARITLSLGQICTEVHEMHGAHQEENAIYYIPKIRREEN